MDFAPHVRSAFKDDHDAFQFGLLDDLHRIRRCIQARATGRQAIAFGIVLGVVQRVVVVDRSRPRLERNPGLGRSTTAPAASAGTFTTTDLPATSGSYCCGTAATGS